MADLSKEDLSKEIIAILKDANLAELSTKKVRMQIEKKYDCNLLARKKEIDEIVMTYVNEHDEDESDAASASDEEKPKKEAKQKPPVKKKPAKRKESVSSADSDDSDAPRSKVAKKDKGKKKKKGSGSGEDDDWKANGKAKKAGPKKGNGFTRPYRLSPELAHLMGAEALPRHEVVKKVWAIIKERNLYDPKNKQFAICDPDLLKVMGIKRFRTFGMLKYLKDHFLD